MIEEDQKVGDHMNGEAEQKDSRTVVLNETLAGQTEQQAAQYGAAADEATVNTNQFDCIGAEHLRIADGRRKDRRVERQFETC